LINNFLTGSKAFKKTGDMDNMKHRRLQEMDRSDFDIVDGDPDIRGWDVKNTRGQKIGEVEDLIVDAQMKKVRYLVLDMDDNELDLDDRKVLIPIGLAELHSKDDDVIIPVENDQLRSLPNYDADKLDESVEQKICSTLERDNTKKAMSGNADTTDFYNHDYFNDDNLYKNRLHEARPVNRNKDSEYESGLRLWERRSEGGILADENRDNKSSRSTQPDSENYREREMKKEERMEMVKNRRNNYEHRRNNEQREGDSYQENVRSYRKDNSIEKRTRDEGLRDG
jgi:sporulation protein YlmC with PRC-barrel domain